MKNCPTVSICVPNFNTRIYLPERFETIFCQTFTDWELIVCDSYSDDGGWEYIKELAKHEPRMRIYQTPREGIYAGFNDCIKEATGKYIYIATSDDTMMPDCLEWMVSTLEANPDCGLCQCELLIIDKDGSLYPEERQWIHYTLGQFDPELIRTRNKRLAPYDGFLHSALFSIYTSVTQLLIRRTAFDRIGMFDGQWGSISDFEWGIRAGLLENCIYIPMKLATWRLHPNQATQEVHTPVARLKMIEMLLTAFKRARVCEGNKVAGINMRDATYFLHRDIVYLGWQACKNRWEIIRFLLIQLFERPRPTIDHLIDKLYCNEWGLWNCENRYRRMNWLIQKYNVTLPMLL